VIEAGAINRADLDTPAAARIAMPGGAMVILLSG